MGSLLKPMPLGILKCARQQGCVALRRGCAAHVSPWSYKHIYGFPSCTEDQVSKVTPSMGSAQVQSLGASRFLERI